MRNSLILLLMILGLARTHAQPISFVVPGTSDPWLAGMPDGTMASGSDIAPAQSPILVTGLSLMPGKLLAFRATGGVVNDNVTATRYPPDGEHIQSHDTGAENGISGATIPIDALVGVFLGPDSPDLSPAPAASDFSSESSRNSRFLQPLLKQVFFIGDGLAGDLGGQLVIAPPGATRFYLGTMDGGGWFNNTGEFSVSVTEVDAQFTNHVYRAVSGSLA